MGVVAILLAVIAIDRQQTSSAASQQVNLDVIDGFIEAFMAPGGSQSIAPEPLAG